MKLYFILHILLWKYNSTMMLNTSGFFFSECHCHLQINSESSLNKSNVFSVGAIVLTLPDMENSFVINGHLHSNRIKGTKLFSSW